MKTLTFADLRPVSAGTTEGSSTGASGTQSGSDSQSSGGTINGAGQLIGAITGAAVCFGTPALPFCVALGSFIGANLPTETSSSNNVMVSDFTAP